jgi:hypothetical protein
MRFPPLVIGGAPAEVRVPYRSEPPAWMPGQEALAHIRRADGCSLSEAIKELKAAISDRQIGARLPDPKSPRRMAFFPP